MPWLHVSSATIMRDPFQQLSLFHYLTHHMLSKIANLQTRWFSVKQGPSRLLLKKKPKIQMLAVVCVQLLVKLALFHLAHGRFQYESHDPSLVQSGTMWNHRAVEKCTI